MTLTADRPESAVSPSARPPGRLRSTVGLMTALGAAALLLALPPVDDGSPAGERMRTVESRWPAAQRADLAATLPDGSAYSPVHYLDVRSSLGTAPTPDGSALRLITRSADGTTRELRRLPLDLIPQFTGFTVAGGQVAWAETVADDDGLGRTEMWTAGVDAATPARRVTADSGDVVFFNSQYDMVIEAGVLHWAAVAPGTEVATELRSVPLAGGPVQVRTEPGTWAMSAWPWLVSAGSGQNGPVRLHNLATGQGLEVDATADEVVTCSPVWCRMLVLPGAEPARIDLVRPDGADRRQVAGGMTAAAVIDVALLDRFEVLSLAGAPDVAVASQRLMLYDERDRQTLVVAEGVGMVQCRDGMLWWSTGDNETATWHSLDLRSLT
ncbi:hypothetical protein AB0M79_12060 [Polymorphospora sp. NPDC051019]|uniref:hypothetical protein n=1 Tax=Polymorphospora sp. NPDC051019 TaxID=3155725 RepID=UPI0034350CD3